MRPSRSGSLYSALLLLLLLICPSQVHGSGFLIFEHGAKATGMAGAFTATADDPSAIFYNVAGIAYQRDAEISAGGTMINFNAEFRGDPFSEFPGADATAFYKDHTFVPPNVYAIVPVGENLTVGLGTFSAFGLRTDWADTPTFPGRFISADANLKTVSVQPSIAWKTANDRFAIGAGVEYRTAHVILERNNSVFNPFTNRVADVAAVRLNSDWDHDIGYNVGLIFKPSETWSVGLSYRAAQDIDFSGDATFTQILTGNPQFDAIVRSQLPPDQSMNATLAFPSLTHFGIATTMIPNWTVEFDVDQTQWDRFKSLDINFEETPENNLSRVENWDNSFSYRLGANHPVTENWEVRLGAVYDETPQPVEAVSPLLPDSDRLGITFGVGYKRGPWKIDVSDMVLHFMDRDTLGRSQDNFNGHYKLNANLFAVNIGYVF